MPLDDIIWFNGDWFWTDTIDGRPLSPKKEKPPMHELTQQKMRASAFLRVAARLRSFSSVNGVCLVPAGLLGDAAGYLELAAHDAVDAQSPVHISGETNASSSR